MACQNCDECEYPTTWGCYYRDYDCEDGCSLCSETGECKYEIGETYALREAFNKLVDEGKVNYNPYILRGLCKE